MSRRDDSAVVGGSLLDVPVVAAGVDESFVVAGLFREQGFHMLTVAHSPGCVIGAQQ